MSQSYPLISCICVTDSRPEMLKRAVGCFEDQNYPNKELVICYPKKDQQTKAVLEILSQYPQLNILRVERDNEISVGNARNLAIDKCKGDYICVWDDDDWYHESRLTFQYNSMKTSGIGYNASVLRRLILFDNTTQKAYISNSYSWENTLLCKKEILFQNQYANRNKGEDTHITKFLDGKKFLYHIEDAPFLYIYIYHGTNTWEYEHYEFLTTKGQLLEEEDTKAICELLAPYTQ